MIRTETTTSYRQHSKHATMGGAACGVALARPAGFNTPVAALTSESNISARYGGGGATPG